MHAERKDWRAARTAYETALRIEPLHADALAQLVVSMVRTGDKDQAKTQFELLLRLRAPDRFQLDRWFQKLNE